MEAKAASVQGQAQKRLDARKDGKDSDASSTRSQIRHEWEATGEEFEKRADAFACIKDDTDFQYGNIMGLNHKGAVFRCRSHSNCNHYMQMRFISKTECYVIEERRVLWLGSSP